MGPQLITKNSGAGEDYQEPVQGAGYPLYVLGTGLVTTVNSAYSAKNVVGGLITFPNALRPIAGNSGNRGILRSARLVLNSLQTSGFNLTLFRANPTASTFTDKTGAALGAADIAKILGSFSFGSSPNSDLGTPVTGGTAAASTILTGSNSANATDGAIVNIGGTNYRLKNTLAQINDVKIGASADATLLSLAKTINGTGVAGTDMFAGTPANPSVGSSSSVSSHTLTLTALAKGSGGNSIVTTTTEATYSFTGGALAGGTDAGYCAYSLNNIQEIVDAAAPETAGNLYGVLTCVGTPTFYTAADVAAIGLGIEQY